GSGSGGEIKAGRSLLLGSAGRGLVEKTGSLRRRTSFSAGSSTSTGQHSSTNVSRLRLIQTEEIRRGKTLSRKDYQSRSEYARTFLLPGSDLTGRERGRAGGRVVGKSDPGVAVFCARARRPGRELFKAERLSARAKGTRAGSKTKSG